MREFADWMPSTPTTRGASLGSDDPQPGKLDHLPDQFPQALLLPHPELFLTVRFDRFSPDSLSRPRLGRHRRDYTALSLEDLATEESNATLRFWTKEGSLHNADNTASNYQLYAPEMAGRVSQICDLQGQLVFTLAEIRDKLRAGRAPHFKMHAHLLRGNHQLVEADLAGVVLFHFHTGNCFKDFYAGDHLRELL